MVFKKHIHLLLNVYNYLKTKWALLLEVTMEFKNVNDFYFWKKNIQVF